MTASKVLFADTDRRAVLVADTLRKAGLVLQVVYRSSQVSLVRNSAFDMISIIGKLFVWTWIEQSVTTTYIASDITRAGEDEKPGSTSAIRARSAASRLTAILATRITAKPTQLSISNQALRRRGLSQHRHIRPPGGRCKPHATRCSLVVRLALQLLTCVPWRGTRQQDSTREHGPLSSYSCHLQSREIGKMRMFMILATEFVCMLNGASSSALFKCSDGFSYVVKPQRPPSANDNPGAAFFFRNLARSVELPVPEVKIVQVDQPLIDNSPELSRSAVRPWLAARPHTVTWHVHGGKRWVSGLHLGSRYLLEPGQGVIIDYLPETMLSRVRNLDAFAGILVIDLWTNMTNPRRATFWKSASEQLYRVAFLDLRARLLATPFRGVECTLDPTRVGLYAHAAVYQQITGWSNFEPVLTKVEGISNEDLESILSQIPSSWTDRRDELPAILDALRDRRTYIRDLLGRCLTGMPQIFPNWGKTKTGPGRESAAKVCEPDMPRRSGSVA